MTWADVTLAQQALIWLTGNLAGALGARPPGRARAAVALPLAALVGRGSGLQLGDDRAAGLGLRADGSGWPCCCSPSSSRRRDRGRRPVAFVALVATPSRPCSAAGRPRGSPQR